MLRCAIGEGAILGRLCKDLPLLNCLACVAMFSASELNSNLWILLTGEVDSEVGEERGKGVLQCDIEAQ